jgi:hypothetical protein
MHELRMHAGLNALRPSSRTVEPKVRYLLGSSLRETGDEVKPR